MAWRGSIVRQGVSRSLPPSQTETLPLSHPSPHCSLYPSPHSPPSCLCEFIYSKSLVQVVFPFVPGFLFCLHLLCSMSEFCGCRYWGWSQWLQHARPERHCSSLYPALFLLFKLEYYPIARMKHLLYPLTHPRTPWAVVNNTEHSLTSWRPCVWTASHSVACL